MDNRKKIDDKSKTEKEDLCEYYTLELNNEILELHSDRNGVINKLIIHNSPKETLNKLLENCFTDSDPKEIGMNDIQFFIGLGIINELNKKTNIILKLFNFYPKGPLSYNYFELHNPDYKKFINDLNIDNLAFQNKMIIVPLNINYHFSLLLIYENKLYLIDYGLVHCSDSNINEILNEIANYESYIKEYLKKNNFTIFTSEVLKIIDEFEKEDDIKNKLKKINEKLNNNNLLDLITKYNSLVQKLKCYSSLSKIDGQGSIITFKNRDLAKNINILNFYSIQGQQTCSYFSLATFKLLTNDEYKFDEICELFSNCIFQLKVIKIVLEEFLQDNQGIIKINENIDENDYIIYRKDEIIIGIKRIINDFEILSRIEKKLPPILKEDIIDMISIKEMLLCNGFCENK